MKIVGAVAEFNPFHKGHMYFINAIRSEMSPEGIVCVMSGDFTQRGCPAVCDKWARAKAAVSCGCDLVIELPTVFCLSSAADFAFGGISILRSLGITDIAFGSESGDAEELKKLASIDTADSPDIREAMSKGLSYPKALSEAIGKDPGPNDILALEYIRQAHGLGIHAVKRSGLSHHASASYIRENMGQIEDFVPEEAFFELSASKFWDEEAEKRLFEMIRYALMIKPSDELKDIMNISEGLENALKKAVDGAKTIDDIIQGAKSKRYTYARISRALMCIVLDMNKDLLAEAKESPLYARVLAMNSKGAAILKNAKELNKEKDDGFEIISNLKKTDVMLAKYKNIIETDIQAADLYTILTGNRVSEYSDFVQKPGIVI